MSVTIMETLQNAKYNLITNGGFPPAVKLAKGQLNNAVVLLEKGYRLEDEIDALLEQYGDIESVPNADEYKKQQAKHRNKEKY